MPGVSPVGIRPDLLAVSPLGRQRSRVLAVSPLGTPRLGVLAYNLSLFLYLLLTFFLDKKSKQKSQGNSMREMLLDRSLR